MANVAGTNATETLNGTGVRDTIRGLGGRDRIDGLGGADTISGGGGADILSGGDGDDTIYGHSVADRNPSSGNIAAALVADVGSGAVFATGAPGDGGFLYALRKDVGDIVRIDPATGAQSVFLDIPGSQFSVGSERGVLGLTFHPGYAANGRFFVHLTNPTGDIEVREYARSAANPALADPAAVATVIAIPHPTFANHNGGALAFGPDGNLYIGVGDGGSANDPNGNAQNTNVLLGKVLRIDVDGDDFPTDPSRNYAIPDGNPFAGATPGAAEIWAYGLRNPWRISFDPVTGDLYIGDVGQSAREEVDFDPAGGPGGLNYGWDYREGALQGPSLPPNPPVVFVEPVFEYPRDVGHSITGGYVYRGPAPGLQGVYVFGDFVTGRLLTLRMVNGVAEDAIDRTDQVVGAELQQIASFGTDNAGQLYVVSLTGAIYRLFPGVAADDGADTINGGAGDDSLFGGAGNDLLVGERGNDRMHGGPGNDVYIVSSSGDVVDESLAGSGGIDTIRSSISFSLADTTRVPGSVERLTLRGAGDIDATGNALDNVITGNSGNNVLIGRSGADTMRGLAGNDVYVVSSGGDIVQEHLAGSGGIDTVQSSINFSLADTRHVLGSVERLALRGTNDTNATGNALDNVITGNAGSNLLSGGAGADNMRGLEGNDVYVVSNTRDIVNEGVAGSSGIDTVRSSISFSLADTTQVRGLVENLTLRGISNIDGAGNALNNVITGNAGNNLLSGGAGADNMRGLAGNDVYIVSSTGDVVNEGLAGSSGIDTVRSSISFSLASTTRVRGSVENLGLRGTDNMDATGNALGNRITGNAGSNVLNGGAGNDTLTGGVGSDAFVFNTPPNAARNVDRITDFDILHDSIRLENAVMSRLGGALTPGEFWRSTTGLAHDATDRIIYETDTGRLTYDGNGSAAGGSVHIATLNPHLALTYADFVVI